MTDVRVAVWGLGTHAVKNILPAVRGCPGLELYGVCSRNAAVVAATANEFACQRWSASEEMLDDPKVDAVYIATPIGLHAAQGRTVLSAGKHLWCEKTLATTLEEADSLLRLSRERGVTVGEGFMYLYHSQFTYLQDVVASGRLGRLHSIQCRFGIPPLEHPGFRVNPALGGGAFLDVGSYPISAVTSLFPDHPEVLLAEIVIAHGSPVDTAGRAVLRYDNDVRVALEWAINRAYRSEIDLWGTVGSVSTERVFSKPAAYVPRFRFLDLHGTERYEAGRQDDHFLAMLEAFRAFVANPVKAEHERELIARRARLLDAIRDKSTRGDS